MAMAPLLTLRPTAAYCRRSLGELRAERILTGGRDRFLVPAQFSPLIVPEDKSDNAIGYYVCEFFQTRFILALPIGCLS